MMSNAEIKRRQIGALILMTEKIIWGKVIGMIKTFTNEFFFIDKEMLPAKRETDTTCKTKTIQFKQKKFELKNTFHIKYQKIELIVIYFKTPKSHLRNIINDGEPGNKKSCSSTPVLKSSWIDRQSEKPIVITVVIIMTPYIRVSLDVIYLSSTKKNIKKLSNEDKSDTKNVSKLYCIRSHSLFRRAVKTLNFIFFFNRFHTDVGH